MSDRRIALFGFPGALRERLVAAILDGRKTATTSLRIEYAPTTPDPLPQPGDCSVVVDSNGQAVAEIETTAVSVLRFDEVALELAREEGEGFGSVDDWRRAHLAFWESDEMREVLNQPDFRVSSETLVVAEWFRLLETDG